MDYLIGFLLGYFLKETLQLIKRVSQWDYDNQIYGNYTPLNEDDLP
jgi:hypothetical protein